MTVALITGGTGGMGRVIAADLVSRGFTVVVTTRSRESGERLRREIGVELLVGDLASGDDVRRMAAEFTARHPALHLLINNAGAQYREHRVTPDGLEMHIAVDYLAGVTLTGLLLDALRAGAPARVVNVVSESLSDTRQVKITKKPQPVRLEPAHLDDLRDLNPAAGFVPFEAYARAKLLTLMSGYLLADRLSGTGVTVNALHPGLVATNIIADVMSPLVKPFLPMIQRSLLTPEEGAAATLHLATAPELAGVSGRYFDRTTEIRSPEVSYDRALQQRLRDATDRFLGQAKGSQSVA